MAGRRLLLLLLLRLVGDSTRTRGEPSGGGNADDAVQTGEAEQDEQATRDECSTLERGRPIGEQAAGCSNGDTQADRSSAISRSRCRVCSQQKTSFILSDNVIQQTLLIRIDGKITITLDCISWDLFVEYCACRLTFTKSCWNAFYTPRKPLLSMKNMSACE
jgi:hypothetical protein